MQTSYLGGLSAGTFLETLMRNYVNMMCDEDYAQCCGQKQFGESQGPDKNEYFSRRRKKSRSP